MQASQLDHHTKLATRHLRLARSQPPAPLVPLCAAANLHDLPPAAPVQSHSQMASSLIYACVARDGSALCEHSCAAGGSGNAGSIARECLAVLQPGQDRLTIVSQPHTINFLRREGWIFVVVTDAALGREVAFAFLQRVSDDYLGSMGALRAGSQSAAAAAAAGPLSLNNLNRSFGPKLKQHLEYANANPEELSRVAACSRKVDDVRGVMVQNIEMVLQRGAKLEVLVDKCEDLQHQAQAFHKQGTQLRTRMWWANARVKLIVVAAVLLLVLTIVLLACFAGGNNCTKRS